ncbi:MAG: hypothetical protein K2X87_19085 [Gemmataceae bacterium]|nr:hypothetical protein [Gemmataceae bacterium]
MSTGRNIGQDRTRTAEVMAGGVRTDEGNPRTNWLGHRLGSKADRIDQMLVDGAFRATLMQARRTPAAVQQHCNHLRDEHGLGITERTDGRLTFDI